MIEIPDWLEKIIGEQADIGVDKVELADTTEKLWAAKGWVNAIRSLRGEIDIVRAQAAAQEKEAAESWTKTDA